MQLKWKTTWDYANFKATAAEAGAACIELSQKDLNSQPKAIKLIFDKVKKHCQDNKIPCFIYIDGLDDAKGQKISKGNYGVLNSSKKNHKKVTLIPVLTS